jgi:hypothetical protein
MVAMFGWMILEEKVWTRSDGGAGTRFGLMYPKSDYVGLN